MQLDRTHIAIRVRTLSEIGDLGLRMVRRYPVAVTRAFFAGAAPWMVINTLLLIFLPLRIASDEFFTDESFSDMVRYMTWMAALVVLQTPLAGAFSTYYLGQAVFEQQPTLRDTFAEIWKMKGPLIWVLGFKRLAIPTTAFLVLRIGSEPNAFLDYVLPWVVVIFVAIVRSNRPFVPEMLILERCSLRSRSPNVITLKRRSKGLHTPMVSELGGRFLAVAFSAIALTGSIYYSLIWVRGVATGNWSADLVALIIFYPLALWSIAAFSVVVRLLGYLDARIRLEGWEVELAIRAEAIRQFGEDAMNTTPVATVAEKVEPVSQEETSPQEETVMGIEVEA